MDQKWYIIRFETGPNMDQKWTKNGPKMVQKWSEIRIKRDLKLTKNSPKMVQNQIKKEPNMDQI